MIIDCDGCTARPHACSDCVVTVLLAMPAARHQVNLDHAEQAAIGVLAASGLVPPLRLAGRGPGGRYAGDGVSRCPAPGTYDEDHGEGAGGTRAG